MLQSEFRRQLGLCARFNWGQGRIDGRYNGRGIHLAWYLDDLETFYCEELQDSYWTAERREQLRRRTTTHALAIVEERLADDGDICLQVRHCHEFPCTPAGVAGAIRFLLSHRPHSPISVSTLRTSSGEYHAP